MKPEAPLASQSCRAILPTGLALAALAALAALLFFVGLGTPGLFDADEPAYAEAAREMLQRGDWITPYFNGAPRFDKPILFYWLLLVSYAVFGVTEFAVRFWSALSGVGLVLLTAWAGRRWFGPPADRWAGVSLATCFLTALLARAAVTDMLLTLFLTGAILAAAAALGAPPQAGRRLATVAWAAAALAVLVKGPIGLLIPGASLVAALALRRELRSGLRLLPWQGPALFLLLALPWYLLVLWANGWAFIEGFVIKHHLVRYTGVVSSHAGPLWFYLPVLLVGFFPWSGYLPTACWRVWGSLRGRDGAGEAGRFVTVCAAWAGVVLLLFSFAGTKLPSYVFPAFPALALLVGGLGLSRPAVGWAGEPPAWTGRLGEGIVGLVGLPLAAGLAAMPCYFDRLAPLARGVLDGVAAPAGPAAALAGLLAAGSLLGILSTGRLRPYALAGMMAGVILVAALVVVPRAHRILQGALQEFSQTARREIPPGGSVVAYGLNAPSIVFYSERRVLPVGAGSPEGAAQIRRRVEAGEPVLVIARSAHAPTLDRVPGLARRQVRGGYVLYESLPR